MTEDQAKATLCCGPPAVAAAAYYRAGVACDAPMHCIGSACMAWREATAPRETLRNYIDDPTVMPKPRMGGRFFPDGWQYAHSDKDHDGRAFDVLHRVASDSANFGFCGLAGPVQ